MILIETTFTEKRILETSGFMSNLDFVFVGVISILLRKSGKQSFLLFFRKANIEILFV